MLIIRDNDYKIVQDDKNETLYTVFFYHYNESLIKSITSTKLLLGTTVTDDYKTITFKATSVKSFNSYLGELLKKNNTTSMKYEDVLQLVLCLVNQLKYLVQNERKTFLGYNPEKIVVINDCKFIYLSSEYLLDIDDINDIDDIDDIDVDFHKQPKSHLITITYPFSQKDFLQSPELELLKEIPSKVHFKTIYYSLGCLLIYALLGDKNYIEENDESISTTMTQRQILIKSLDFLPIKGTQLYNLIKRCLEDEPNKRSVLFI